MPFQSRAFWQPKDEGHPGEYEDAFALNAASGVAAIADGVSSSLFSDSWARLLTQQAVDTPPDPSNLDELRNWLAPLRQQWQSDVSRRPLKWNERGKLNESGGGAFATLLWMELDSEDPATDDDEAAPDLTYRCFALGDCCLFHVRDGQVLRTFPMEHAADFDLDPQSLCSRDRDRDHVLEFQSIEDSCRYGDLLVLASDAIAAWMIAQVEAEDDVPWNEFWQMNDEGFADRVRSLREGKQIRYDDTTLVLLQVVAELADEQESTEEDTPLEPAERDGVELEDRGEQEDQETDEATAADEGDVATDLETTSDSGEEPEVTVTDKAESKPDDGSDELAEAAEQDAVEEETIGTEDEESDASDREESRDEDDDDPAEREARGGALADCDTVTGDEPADHAESRDERN